jgi:hypothetical protein
MLTVVRAWLSLLALSDTVHARKATRVTPCRRYAPRVYGSAHMPDGGRDYLPAGSSR